MQPEEEATGTAWSYPQYFASVPALEKDNVINYFSLSPFYDPKCTNTILHQSQLAPDQIQAALATWKGKQYALDGDERPRLWSIIRSYRTNLNKIQTTGMFYIIDDKVYQSPTLRSVLQYRLASSVFHLHEAFNTLSSFTEYDPLCNYSWNKKKSESSLQPDPRKNLEYLGHINTDHLTSIVSAFPKRFENKLKRQNTEPDTQPNKKQRKV
uniref:Mediator of RNA polymerase II transcription subunit 6 n=1 Tax=Arcella intermedia TaxID=1963864 RepID=A0A6B2LI61_9EUKA